MRKRKTKRKSSKEKSFSKKGNLQLAKKAKILNSAKSRKTKKLNRDRVSVGLVKGLKLNNQPRVLSNTTKKKIKERELVLPLYFGWALQIKVSLIKYHSYIRKLFGLRSVWQEAVALVLLVAVVSSSFFFFQNVKNILAATFYWVQTSWVGGADTVNFPVHPTDKTGWTKFYSKDSQITAGTELTLVATSTSVTQTTDDDFNAGTKDSVYVSGGNVYLQKPLGITCSAAIECVSGNCVDGVCCDTACTGTCNTCSNADGGAAGTCHDTADNYDLDNECSASWTSCDSSCVKRGPDSYCDGAGACDTNDATANVSANKVCSSGSEVDATSTSLACDGSVDYYVTIRACTYSQRYAECNGSGSCDTNAATYYEGSTQNVPDNKVALDQSGGSGTPYQDASSTTTSCDSSVDYYASANQCTYSQRYAECNAGACDTNAATYYEGTAQNVPADNVSVAQSGGSGLPYSTTSRCSDCKRCDASGGCNNNVTLTYGGSHTECQCLALPGTVYDTGSGAACKYSGATVPTGWTQAQNWQQYDSTGWGCDGCGYNCATAPTSWSNVTATSYGHGGGVALCGACKVGRWNSGTFCALYQQLSYNLASYTNVADHRVLVGIY